MYDPAHRIYASNSTATFSVKWPAARRRLSDAATPGLSHSDGSDAADAITEVLLTKIEESRLSHKSDIAAIRSQIVLVGVIVVVALMVVMMLAAAVVWMLLQRSKKV